MTIQPTDGIGNRPLNFLNPKSDSEDDFVDILHHDAVSASPDSTVLRRREGPDSPSQ